MPQSVFLPQSGWPSALPAEVPTGGLALHTVVLQAPAWACGAGLAPTYDTDPKFFLLYPFVLEDSICECKSELREVRSLVQWEIEPLVS